MNLMVAGSRNVDELSLVHDAIFRGLNLLNVKVEEITCVISGGARGVDRLGEMWASRYGKSIRKFIPDWAGTGRGAGLIRNVEMINVSDVVICIWDGQSKGTKHSIETAKKKGVMLVVYRTDLELGEEGQLTAYNCRQVPMF